MRSSWIRRLMVPLAVLCVLMLVPPVAQALTIDATALTSPSFKVFPGVGGSIGPFSTGTVETLALDPGTYVFSDEANGLFSFDVDAAGIVTYAPSIENFVHGSGTTTLTVRGFDVTFDATALTSPLFRIDHVFTPTSTSVVRNATMLPNDFYPLADGASNQIVFNVDYNGHFQFVPGSEDYLSGAGTPHLVVQGFTVTVDVTALTAPSFRVDGILNFVPTTSPVSITGIPGPSYLFRDNLSDEILFEIDPDGRIQYNPSFEAFVDGAGTSTFTVDGFPLSIDPCGLAPITPAMYVAGLDPSASTASIFHFTAIPGGGYFVAAGGDLLYFQVDASGHYAGLPSTFLGLPVFGGGISTLGIGACAGVGSVAGQVVANCPAADSPLLGVRVDVFEDGSGDLVGTAVTDASGHYLIEDVGAGAHTVGIVTPLGYSTAVPELAVTISGGQEATANFALLCTAVTGNPRAAGFWKHQVGVATGGNGQAQVDASTLCSYLDLIAAHFNSNAINQVVVYDPPASGLCSDKLQVARQLLNLVGSAAMIERAKQQLTALLLNVAAGYVSQAQIVSVDGATASQAITYCDNLIDNPSGDHALAKTIAEMINSGQMAPAGTIPLATPVIAYGLRPGGPAEGRGGVLGLDVLELQVTPNPARAERTFSFAVGRSGAGSLAIYDVSGRRVAELCRGPIAPGRYTVTWDGKQEGGGILREGLYFAQLSVAGRTRVVKVAQTAP